MIDTSELKWKPIVFVSCHTPAPGAISMRFMPSLRASISTIRNSEK